MSAPVPAAPLPREEIEQIDRLHETATPGPWTLCHHLKSAEHDASCPCGYRGGVWGDNGEAVVFEMGATPDADGDYMLPQSDRPKQLADAHLIVALRNAWPGIKAEIEAGRAGGERVKELEAEVARLEREISMGATKVEAHAKGGQGPDYVIHPADQALGREY